MEKAQFVELLGTAPASIDDGKLTFVRGSLATTLSPWKDRYNRSAFGWMVYTDCTALRDRMDGFGGVGIRIDHLSPSGDTGPSAIPPAACCPWPSGSAPLSSEATAGVTRYGPASLRFVRDFHDLGRLRQRGHETTAEDGDEALRGHGTLRAGQRSTQPEGSRPHRKSPLTCTDSPSP
ncbi:hypothetical protein GCM10010275_55480 [Streptomyces litmocidini]|nr:hypothetical protein GCM10010275_55480 [Streptomyces litmocidini]